MQIIKGKLPCTKKVVVYGPEGIGKSTFLSKFPGVIFSDTEGSTSEIDVSRFPKPTSWEMLMEQIAYIKKNPSICQTYAIDTIDWAEQMCVESVCARYQKNGIEDFGYGNGYVYTKEEFGRFLNKLQELIDVGINVALAAHAQIRKFEQPDELGAYDRYELKLGKKTSSQTSPLVKEWADVLLFVNYKTISVAVDDKGKKHKAQGGQRVMYTSHHPCWDAKNRYGLPEEMPFTYEAIKSVIESNASQAPVMEKPATEEPSAIQTPVMEKSVTEAEQRIDKAPVTEKPVNEAVSQAPVMEKPATTEAPWRQGVSKALLDLMDENNICEWDIQNVVSAKGYYPFDTAIAKYEEGFVKGVLISAWPQVLQMIKEMKDKMEVPFN